VRVPNADSTVGCKDIYFSADVETDGPIPGRFSMLSFALVYAGTYDGKHFHRPPNYAKSLYSELRPISSQFEPEALAVNGLDRDRLLVDGRDPVAVMSDAAEWVRLVAGDARPVLVAYPVSFDWAWLYWYFVNYASSGSPFGHSNCYDLKTALSVKARRPISASGRSKLPTHLQSQRVHTHNALDDAVEQAEIFANVFEWGGEDGT